MYKIIRTFLRDSGKNRVVKRNLTLEQAQAHCQDPETSWRTCKKPRNVRRTVFSGPWFDGYEEQ